LNENHDPSAETRREMIRQATRYMYGYIAAAIVVAIAGAAFVAFMLRGTGWPFLRTWGVLILVLLVPPAIAAVVRAVRTQRR
jgi:predicted PurR-regulated permease PerM